MRFNYAKQIAMAGILALTVAHPGIALAGPTTMQGSTMSTTNQSTSLIDELKLSPAQKKAIAGILATRNRDIAKNLNATQRAKFQQSLQSRTKLSVALQSLGLNATQKKDITAIVRKANQDIRGQLTPTQQQQLAKYMQQRRTSAQAPIE